MIYYVSTAGLYETTNQINTLLIELSEIQPNDKVYFHNKKLYRDIISIYQPIIRFFHIRSRSQTINDMNEIFEQYFSLANQILILKFDDENMLKLHCKMICGWIRGLENLIITYNGDRNFIKVMGQFITSLINIHNKLDYNMKLIYEVNIH